jgi:hypothetical protein
MSDQRTPEFDWALWLQWLAATTLGWVLGGMMLAGLALGVAGVVLGTLQWVVLRQRLRQAGWWILASAGGWTIGWVTVSVVIPPESWIHGGAVLGTAIGAAQWLVLHRQFYQAGWWVIISALAWTIALEGLTGELLVGAVVGAVTGIALELLLRYPETLKV